MNAIHILTMLLVISGCATTTKRALRPALVNDDISLAHNYLNALYRPNTTDYRLVADATAEEIAINGREITMLNRELRQRIKRLKNAPKRVIMVNLHSADNPEPRGSDFFLYSYDTVTGDFEKIKRYDVDADSPDMWIEIRHWPDNTRLVDISLTWLDDLKNNSFHLRSKEKVFRFASAVEPLISYEKQAEQDAAPQPQTATSRIFMTASTINSESKRPHR